MQKSNENKTPEQKTFAGGVSPPSPVPSSSFGSSTTSSSAAGIPSKNNPISSGIPLPGKPPAGMSDRTNEGVVLRSNHGLIPNVVKRKTANGGYPHTAYTKQLISIANSGKTPWNLGKRRSEADKKKISEGVRARNRELLLGKLELKGMTEEDYKEKRKKLKYLRENVRRAKIGNNLEKYERLSAELKEKVDEIDLEKNVYLAQL